MSYSCHSSVQEMVICSVGKPQCVQFVLSKSQILNSRKQLFLYQTKDLQTDIVVTLENINKTKDRINTNIKNKDKLVSNIYTAK